MYAGHSMRKWFSSSTLFVPQIWHILSSHDDIGIAQHLVSLWSLWEFVFILAMLIFFFILVKKERYFWSSRLRLITSLYYPNFLLSSNSLSHHNFSLNLDIIIFLILSLFYKLVAPLILNSDIFMPTALES